MLDPINRVLLPRADIATEHLVARLTELGWEAEDVTAYRTVRAAPPPAPIREAIKGGGYDAVLFTSSSTVRNLVGIAGKPHAVTVIAVIGPQTAKTAAEFGLRVDVTAPKPSMASLVEALAEFGAGQRAAAVEAGEPLASQSSAGAGPASDPGRTRPQMTQRPRQASTAGAVTALGRHFSVNAGFPVVRPRRLRRTAALRNLVAETALRPADLVLPMFLKEGIAEPQPIGSMPGVVQHTRDSLRKAAVEAVDAEDRRAHPVRHSRRQGRPGLCRRRPGQASSGSGIWRPGPAEVGDATVLHGGPVPGRVHRPRPLRPG